MENVNILYGDIVVRFNNKEKKLEGCVFREDETHYKRMEILKILTSKIIGQTVAVNGYVEVKKSDEERNKITGAYE